MGKNKPVPGRDGNKYVPFEERTGESSVVFFTRDLSEKGLIRIYDRVSSVLCGKVAVKLHTGEAEGPNIIPRPWVKELFASRLPDATIIETNTYYEGSRYTTEEHRRTLEINGWTFCPVDITDEHGVAALPVKGGKWFTEMHVGESMLNYDSLLVLTHFKGHVMGGFGGSNKNIGIGCADGRIGKRDIHTAVGSDNMWSIAEEELMERISGRAGRHAGRRARRLAGHPRGGQRLHRPHLCAARRRRKGPDRARREPSRPAAAELYEETRHGQRPLYAHRHRQRRRPRHGRRGGKGRRSGVEARPLQRLLGPEQAQIKKQKAADIFGMPVAFCFRFCYADGKKQRQGGGGTWWR